MHKPKTLTTRVNPETATYVKEAATKGGLSENQYVKACVLARLGLLPMSFWSPGTSPTDRIKMLRGK